MRCEKRRSAPSWRSADGPHTWQTQITYRAGTAVKELTLSLKAQVINDVAVQPAAVTLLTGGVVSQEIVLADRRSQPLRVTEIRTSSPRLTARAVTRLSLVVQPWRVNEKCEVRSQ